MGKAALPHTFGCAVLLVSLFVFVFVCFFCSDCAASDECWYAFAVVDVDVCRCMSYMLWFQFVFVWLRASIIICVSFQVELLKLLESQQELTQ